MKYNRLVLALLLAASCSLTSCYTSYYYLVRHAEKEAAPTDDPPLTPAGMQRAIALKDSLQQKNVTGIFVSQYLRTRQTAEPAATAFHITPTTYHAGESMNTLATSLREINGPNILVVGHSNTIPALIKSLTGTTVIPISDNDYDNLYIIKRVKNLNGNTFSLHRIINYGAPSP